MNDLVPLVLMQAQPGIPEHRDRPTAEDWADSLTTFPLFTDIPKRRLRTLARHATLAEFGPGERILFSGDLGNSLYLILGGDVKAVTTTEARTLRRGDYFGEVAMLGGGPRSATVVATGYVQVMKLPAASFQILARRHPAITFRMLRDLTARLRRVEEQAAGAA